MKLNDKAVAALRLPAGKTDAIYFDDALPRFGYRLRKGSKLLYRQPAFLICTDPQLDLQMLLQAYIDRWEIECNHRDEKSLLGAAQGQVCNPLAVARLPQFQVAIYSLLLLAILMNASRVTTLTLSAWTRWFLSSPDT